MTLKKPFSILLGLIASISLFADFAAGEPAKAAATAETVILCLGDSLTEGYGVPQENSWPTLLQNHLEKSGKSVRVINSGISGSTTASGPGRLKWYLKGDKKPDIVILALGANDGLRGQDVSGMKSNLKKTIEMAKASGIRTVLAGMKMPPNYGQDYANAFEKVFPDLAKELKIELIPFLLDGVAAQKEFNLADGIHPNPKGYEIVIKNVLKTIEPMLKDK